MKYPTGVYVVAWLAFLSGTIAVLVLQNWIGASLFLFFGLLIPVLLVSLVDDDLRKKKEME